MPYFIDRLFDESLIGITQVPPALNEPETDESEDDSESDGGTE